MRLILITGLLISLQITFSACSKTANSVNAKISCRISQVFDADSSLLANFYYTEWGAPQLIKRTQTRTGEYDHMFYYNNNRQLIGYRVGIFKPADTGNVAYFKYHYEGDQIVSDTMFSNGYLEDPALGEFSVGKYTYDSIGRIIHYSTWQSGAEDSLSYNYIWPAGDPFTDNHSVLSGNKELMFVNRDYSTQNDGAIRFNDRGYPVTFAQWINGAPSDGYSFQGMYFSHVSYECGY